MRYVCEFDYSDTHLLRDVVSDDSVSLAALQSELGIGLDGGQLLRCYPLSIAELEPHAGFVRRDEPRKRSEQ